MSIKIISPQNIQHGVQEFDSYGGTCARLGGSVTYDAPVPSVGEVYLPDDTLYESPKPPRDNAKFSVIKKSGQIKMTPYARSRIETKYYPVLVRQYSFDLGRPSCTDGSWVGPQIKVVSSWDAVYTISSPTNGNIERPNVDFDLASEQNSLRASVVSDNLQTYDLLTEMSEIKETAQFILNTIKSVRHPLESFDNLRRSLEKNGQLKPNEVKKHIESKWMEYRYAIMPLYYSVQDQLKLLKGLGNVYKTSRKSKKFSQSVVSPVDRSRKGIYTYTREDVSYKLTAVGKASYEPGSIDKQLFDQIGLNPFQTAWELIPYSFVVDWFANVGDWVLAHTASLVDYSSQRVFCESVKIERTVTTYLYVNQRYYEERVYNDHAPQVVSVGPLTVVVDEPLMTQKEQRYYRNLFTPSDVELQSDVFISWKRAIDAWVLGQRPLIASLRSLRK